MYAEAIEEGLNAVGLIYHFPFAHYHLGEALYNFGEVARAAEAFNVCLSMSPNVGKARNWLVKIYEELNQQEKADLCTFHRYAKNAKPGNRPC